MRIKGNFFIILCVHVCNLRVHVETSCGDRQRTSHAVPVYDEAARVSDTKLHERDALKHAALEHSLSRVFTRSVVAAAFKQPVVQCGMWQDEPTAEPLQDREPKLAKGSQLRDCREIPVEPDNDRHRCGTWLHCEVRSRTPFGLASFCRTGQDQQRCRTPLLLPEGAQPTDSPMAHWSDGFEHTVTDINARRAPSDSGCRQET